LSVLGWHIVPFFVFEERDCSLDLGRGCRPGRGEGWGDSFQGGPNMPRPRSGGPAGGAARESENDPGKKDGPPWRNCLTEREPRGVGNASAGSS
jgi:hypothetical protein